MIERVILVDTENRQVGTMEKMEVHRKGLLHRAFSIFIFNTKGEMLIHQRADSKYHCGGLWTNAVCSHPRPGEAHEEALRRKMIQEMGFYTEVKKAFDFSYRAILENGLIEHEYDEVFFGIYEGKLEPNPSEVQQYRYMSLNEIRDEVRNRPETFTPWFKLLFERMSEYYSSLERA
jgi:isopentenyl-diphosphate delta-isomerase